MKSIFAKVVLAASCMVLVGCGRPSEPANIVEGVAESDIEEYNRLMEESQAGYAEGDAAAKKAGL